jgi:predicted nucleotidyltransferase component of viral defense system
VTAQLAASFPGQLVFKGGFVLRHVHGIARFSKDVDATRTAPPRHKLDAGDVAEAIRQASIGDQIRFAPAAQPATDSARSLDFDHVAVSGALLPPTDVQVEISYREAVVEAPQRALIGAPFYEDFEILALAPQEMAAEKLRTLAQRTRPTDLADLAALLSRRDVRDDDIARIAVEKFKAVKPGLENRARRVERNLQAIGADYDAVVPGLFPSALPYREALDAVWPRIKPLIP